MANTLQLKRSSVASKIPLTTDLALGEMAINTNDGKVYIKRDNGTQSIVLVGGPVSTTDRILGRQSAGGGNVEEIICTSAGRALLDDVDAAAQRTTLGLGTLATQSGTFSGTSSGTNTGDQTITLTGDVTGSGTGSFSTTIANDAVTSSKILNSAVTLAKQADVATGTVFYRKTAGTGAPEVQTLSALKTDLGLTGTNSGDQNTFSTISVSGGGSITPSTPSQTLTLIPSTGVTITADDMMKTLTIAATGGTIDDGSITYAKIQNVTNQRLLGRSNTGNGPIQEIFLGSNLSFNGTTLNSATFQKIITSGTAAPSGGIDGDIYIQYT